MSAHGAHIVLLGEPGAVPKGRAQLIGREIVLHAKLGFRHTRSKLAENQCSRNARTGDHRLPERDFRVSDDSRNDLGSHAATIARRGRFVSRVAVRAAITAAGRTECARRRKARHKGRFRDH
jgi:hypothetical protein